MLRAPNHRSFLIAMLLTTAACTQEPAKIDLMGQNSYTRSGTTNVVASNAKSYDSYTPSAGAPTTVSSGVYNTGSTAPIQSIGVSDLTPPSNGTPASNKVSSVKTGNVPFAAASSNKSLPSDEINPWTNAPRTTAAFDSLDESFYLKSKGQKMATNANKEPEVAQARPASAPAKAVKLDNIASNDDEAPVVKQTGVTKSPKKAEVASSSGFMWPVNSKKVISEFGPKGKGKVNDGINIASAAGEPVWASADGEVVYVGNELQGYGNMIIIKHNGEKTSTYAHLNRYTVDKYDRVKQGDIIGYVGNTGNVKDPQLHFAIRNGKDAVDPMKYLKRDVASLR